ncbi:glycosyltransferase [Thermogymnomonas acidicola]|uniref:glycosyltransferase n=1 Tax=Thermogymnomonas acidicola TaxID=399579 RepID=UPI00094682E3|nr:glycosyltransferase [Thermogymnomonas acidicola]
MKILRLNSVAGPPGGVEAYIEGVDRILSKYGHETRTITLTTGVRREKSVNEIEIVSPPPSPLTRAINDVIPSDEVYEALLSEYRTFRPDLIHLHHLRIGFASVVRFLRSVEEPVVFTAHDALAVCPLSTLVKPGNVICEGGASVRCAFTGCRIHSHLPYELILSRAFRELSESSIRAFICPSYAVMRYFSRFNFRPTVHLLSFSHFDPKLVSEEPRYGGEILSRNGVGYIGRLDKYKGVDDLIKAFKIFSKRHEGSSSSSPVQGRMRATSGNSHRGWGGWTARSSSSARSGGARERRILRFHILQRRAFQTLGEPPFLGPGIDAEGGHTDRGHKDRWHTGTHRGWCNGLHRTGGFP